MRQPATQRAAPMRIAAAADLEPVLPPILRAFEQQSGIRTQASFASSATLASQIESGAPFDVFLSADMALPEKMRAEGLAADASSVQPYARGTLVLWTRTGSGLGMLSMAALAQSSVHSVAIANPEHAPYGRAAMAAITTLGLLESVRPKLRIAENIAQAAQFASTGNADAGLLSLSSAVMLSGHGHWVPVPANAYPPILQGALALRGGARTQEASAFLSYLHTPVAEQQLRRGGLEPLP